jgi:hypothetical protein
VIDRCVACSVGLSHETSRIADVNAGVTTLSFPRRVGRGQRPSERLPIGRSCILARACHGRADGARDRSRSGDRGGSGRAKGVLGRGRRSTAACASGSERGSRCSAWRTPSDLQAGNEEFALPRSVPVRAERWRPVRFPRSRVDRWGASEPGVRRHGDSSHHSDRQDRCERTSVHYEGRTHGGPGEKRRNGPHSSPLRTTGDS